MTHEQNLNKELGDCTYKQIARHDSTFFWERACGNNDIDFVIGLKFPKNKTPVAEDFDMSKKSSIALRYIERADAASYFFTRTGIKI